MRGFMQSLYKVTTITPNGPITLIKFGFECLLWNCQSDGNNLVFLFLLGGKLLLQLIVAFNANHKRLQ